MARPRGVTLFETVIAVFLFTTLVMALSLALMSEAGRRIQHSGERAGDLAAGRAIDRLRTDVWASSSIAIPFDYDPYGLWYEGPLVLEGHASGYDLAYGVVDGSLQRAVRVPGSEAQVAELLRDVSTFRWRFLDGVARRTVEVEIERTETPTFRGRVATAYPPTITDRFVLSPRRVQARQW